MPWRAGDSRSRSRYRNSHQHRRHEAQCRHDSRSSRSWSLRRSPRHSSRRPSRRSRSCCRYGSGSRGGGSSRASSWRQPRRRHRRSSGKMSRRRRRRCAARHPRPDQGASEVSRSPRGSRRTHWKWHPGQELGPSGRYVVEQQFGTGAFSCVLGCLDRKMCKPVAVKVLAVKGSSERQQRKAKQEIDVLRLLDAQGGARHSCVRLLDSFVHGQLFHCLVFESLGTSLTDILENSGERGFLLADVQTIARQLLGALAFIHSAGLVHADVKGKNIMLRSGDFSLVPHPRCLHGVPYQAPRLHRPCEVVLIDFGCALVPPIGGDQKTPRPGARQIRAPEVILGLQWDILIDVWSLGCVLGALYKGCKLFSVHDDMEHLATIEHLLDASVPRSMSCQVSERILAKGVVFDSRWRLAWPSCARDARAVQRVKNLQRLQDFVLPRHDSFLEFLLGLLEIEPRKRLTVQAALEAKFLTLPVVE
mmetsp:Transcript_76516/g.140054  ORF Transcript_76516/g.140054 Transcript_76516/m.140054 type:complete len:476 (+) Transcript_76516:71-1498(+)